MCSILLSELAKTEDIEARSQIDIAANNQEKSPATKKKVGKDSAAGNSQMKSPKRDPMCGLPFAVVKFNDPKSIAALEMNAANQRRLEAKRRFRYCYECGRLLGRSFFLSTSVYLIIYRKSSDYQKVSRDDSRGMNE